MMHLRNLFAAFFASLALAACTQSPRYETQYELVVPPTQSGKDCANQCYLEFMHCKEGCYVSNEQCEARQSLRAHMDYSMWGGHRGGGFGVGIGSPRYYDRYYGCPWPGYCLEHCEEHYRDCFTRCGGQVIPHTICTQNCPAPAAATFPPPPRVNENLPWDQ